MKLKIAALAAILMTGGVSYAAQEPLRLGNTNSFLNSVNAIRVEQDIQFRAMSNGAGQATWVFLRNGANENFGGRRTYNSHGAPDCFLAIHYDAGLLTNDLVLKSGTELKVTVSDDSSLVLRAGNADQVVGRLQCENNSDESAPYPLVPERNVYFAVGSLISFQR